MTWFPSVVQVEQIHMIVMKQYGEGEQAGVKEFSLLDSATHRPQAAFGGESAYPSLFDKAAALFESLARNHCFYNGNKRTAFAMVDVFLKKNGYKITKDISITEPFTLAVAQGHMQLSDISGWFETHVEGVE